MPRAFLGTPVYMIVQDSIARTDPYYWNFWLGLLLVLVVLFVRGGLIGIGIAAWRRLRRRPA